MWARFKLWWQVNITGTRCPCGGTWRVCKYQGFISSLYGQRLFCDRCGAEQWDSFS